MSDCVCKLCFRVLSSPQAAKNHMDNGRCKKKKFFCKICHTGFSTKPSLRRHEKRKHEKEVCKKKK
jgi:hypothetical protein